MPRGVPPARRQADLAAAQTTAQQLPTADKIRMPVRELADLEAKRAWKELVAMASEYPTIRIVDKAMMIVYANTYSLWKRATRDVEERGIVLFSLKTGGAYQNPSVAVITSTRQTLVQLLKEMGYTPASRGRVVLDVEAERDDVMGRLIG